MREIIDTRLMVSQSAEPAESDTLGRCATHTEPLTTQPTEGQQFGIVGPVAVSRLLESGDHTARATYDPTWSGDMLTVNLPDLTLQVRPAGSARSFVWCHPADG